MWQSIIIVDDFYDDGMEVRARALELEYPDHGGTAYYSGRNSRLALMNDAIVATMSRLVAHPLVPSPKAANGHFRIALDGDLPRQDIHIDPGRDWAGVLYLTLPENCRGGTSFWRHKELGLEQIPLDDEEIRKYGFRDYEHMRKTITDGDGLDRAKWEHALTVPMRFNRLVLFRSWLWHSHAENFGASLDDGRLIQLFFFDYAGVRQYDQVKYTFDQA